MPVHFLIAKAYPKVTEKNILKTTESAVIAAVKSIAFPYPLSNAFLKFDQYNAILFELRSCGYQIIESLDQVSCQFWLSNDSLIIK